MKRELRERDFFRSWVPPRIINADIFYKSSPLDRRLLYSGTKKIISRNHAEYSNTLFLTGGKLEEIVFEARLAFEYSMQSKDVSSAEQSLSILWFVEGASEEVYRLAKMTLEQGMETSDLAAMVMVGDYFYGNSTVLNKRSDNEDSYKQYLPLTKVFNRDDREFLLVRDVYSSLIEARSSKLFENFIRDKTICIVGNSPCEFGSSKGAFIDSHDIVIRFNNFEKPIDDYGCKTDIWVKSGAGDLKEREPWDGLKLVIWEEDIDSSRIHVNTLASMISLNGVVAMDYIGREVHLELREKLNCAIPSTGLITCYVIYKCLGSLNRVSLCGFNFLDNLRAKNSHQLGSPVILHHNWMAEKEAMDKMLEGVL